MSYNINTWRTKELQNLVIPLKEIQKIKYIDVKLVGESSVEIYGPSEGFSINGILNGDQIEISKIETSGEGSGSNWKEFCDMLKTSTGKLIATQVWEGGDSITRLIVEDGKVTEESIEI